ncbi:tyrosyl-tRNA synthetase [Geosmithia morbida]|uniref:Tyrosine--tRNA ligase n=1 Tax=Geosmithia morbida TaxID=1094350 RepID=A0A9P5D2G4_9HYPO|nr:tyrosyl-tRNA synthetase [Geosmithia morbida]KAF4125028.1 tyrosyl-tRNA synthetase [Geosmithia morbida]
MAPRMAMRSLAARRCTNCLVAGRYPGGSIRGISTTYLDKVDEGEKRWRERAEKIQSGELPHVWDLLAERGYIKDVAGNPDKIKEVMRIKRMGAYVGIDPTADSMHLGHLLPFMALFWLWFHGHPAVLLLGGSTARIGDPTDRLESREILSNAAISKNITKLHFQLSRLWTNVVHLRDKYGYQDDWAAKKNLLNNNMWLGEFMYPLLQGWDFWHLYSKQGVQMQIGGSDQYGNIVSGIEVLKTVRSTEEAPHFAMPTDWKNEPFGFTVPLLTDSSGAKFGKSAGNAMWLDEYKTSPFDLYGYFMRRPDEELDKLLRLFTFMPTSQIEQIMAEHRADPAARVANHHLAFEVLSLVYGSQRALQEAQQHQFRFGGKLPRIVKEPVAETGIVTPNTAPRADIKLPRSVIDMSPAKILFACGLASSASDGQRLVAKQGAYVAGQPGQDRGLVPGNLSWTPMKMWFPGDTAKFVIDEKILILRKGKHNVRIIELVTDEEWNESGNVYPGQPFTGTLRRVVQKIKEEAAARGEELTDTEIRRMLKDSQDSKSTRVANNPGIELPSKAEMRQKKQKRTGA